MTAILVGYLMVWLPQPTAGLSFLGFELGEWIKFIPSVREEGFLPGRTSFFVPPICLALMILLWSAEWPSRHWQTWTVRLLAVCVAGLAIPPLEVIRFEASDQWLPRVMLIGLVLIAAIASPLWRKAPQRLQVKVQGWTLFLVGSAGALLPTWAYFAVRPLASEILATPVGIGPGVFLNLIGNLIVSATGIWHLFLRVNK